MKCANPKCGRYVSRHSLKDAQACLAIISKMIAELN